MLRTFTCRKTSNLHTHGRQDNGPDPLLPVLAPLIANTSYHTVFMPNLTPPIKTGIDAEWYTRQIMKYIPVKTQRYFNPIVPIKLLWGNDFKTTPQVIEEAHACGVRCAKMYMRGVTTNSEDGIRIEDIHKLYPTFLEMAQLGWRLQIHGEHPGKRILAIDREYAFHPWFIHIHEVVPNLHKSFEHISDRRTIDLIKEMPANVAGTLSTHFLYMTLNDVVEPGLRPKNSCKPIAKGFYDCDAIVEAAISGNPKFYWGSDIAGHIISKKYMDCGACGCFPGQYDVLWVLQKFDEMNALDKFEAFASINGPLFYGLKVPEAKITFNEVDAYPTDKMFHNIEIWKGGETLRWKVAE